MIPMFSVIVVCLNPGEKLKLTLDSIKAQTFENYEIIIKDGLSTDGSLAYFKEMDFPKGKLIEKEDSGIYDAMNQAAKEARGKYVYFLNCGDTFFDKNVLREIAEFINKNPAKAGIYYGNIFERLTGQAVNSNPNINEFACFRNVPCHQACFYKRELVIAHPFRVKYKVRADYEQFLWCFFQGKARCYFKERLIADYEGGGFSETKENRRISAKEHKEIVCQYMSRGQVLKYRAAMWITLAPLRTWIAGNEKTAGFYNRIKKAVYKIKKSI